MPPHDERQLRRLCGGEIPEKVRELYTNVQRVWNRVGSSEIHIHTLCLIVAMAENEQPKQAQVVDKRRKMPAGGWNFHKHRKPAVTKAAEPALA